MQGEVPGQPELSLTIVIASWWTGYNNSQNTDHKTRQIMS